LDTHKPIKILGIDYGLRKIGVAIGQTLLGTSSPIGIVTCQFGEPNWPQLSKIITEWAPDRIVIGMPYNIDDSENDMTEKVKIFGEAVAKKYKLPVFFEDEKLTTKLANSELAEMQHYKKSPKKIPNLVDAFSACMIVESYIQNLLRNKM
jgi:putative Holliday junction resolvase